MADAWVVMPVVNNWEMTRHALDDLVMQQGVDVRVLVILQGDVPFREEVEQRAERDPHLFVWSHNPPLPSLSATWNRALRFVWSAGGSEALVVNNDVRLHKDTYRMLSTVRYHQEALFVSAVGVREPQFNPAAVYDEAVGGTDFPDFSQRGGPDFSCFLISSACHWKYPFDEQFIPAYCEDLDLHRRMMLGGDGTRIFSVNLPYLHYASQTLASSSAEERERFAQRAQQARDHYQRKWGGKVNQERFTKPFDEGSAMDGVTTPELQRRVQDGEPVELLGARVEAPR